MDWWGVKFRGAAKLFTPTLPIHGILAAKWLTVELVELYLSQQPSKLVVTPLKSVPEGHRGDEVRIGDTAMLLGQYVAIVEPEEGSRETNGQFIMTNYLKIVSMEEQNKSRREKNRREDSNAMATCYIK